jgi:hypothetical protein
VPERTAEQIQHEIEQARDALACAVDQLATSTNPKRLANDAKQSLPANAQTPAGKAVIGGVVVVVGLLVFRCFRCIRRRHGSDDYATAQVYNTAEYCHRETLLYANSGRMRMYAIDSIAIRSVDDDLGCWKCYSTFLKLLRASYRQPWIQVISMTSV